MAATENTILGLAKQSAFGTPNTTHGDFTYFLFRQGSAGPQNAVIPLDPEVGGGALLRSMVKVAVSSGGALDVILRPESMGHLLYGVTGGTSDASDNEDQNGIVGPVPLLVGAQAGYTDRIHQPETATVLTIVGNNAACSGNVTIYGEVAGVPDSDTIALNGTTPVDGVETFTTVTAIDFPAYSVDGTEAVSVGYDTDYYTHKFWLASDNFSAPYYTVRYAPGGVWGEQYQDALINAFTFGFRAAAFSDGAAGFIGGKPTPIVTTSWNATADDSPQFITPYGDIELPTGTSAKVLGGSFLATAGIPMDQAYVVGSFFPDQLELTNRAYALNMTVKVNDDTLYKKMMYTPFGGDAWAAAIFQEADFKLYFRSEVGQYAFRIEGNGSSYPDANVLWSATPIDIRPGRQMVMNVTGIFVADSDNPGGSAALSPIVLTLVNKTAAY